MTPEEWERLDARLHKAIGGAADDLADHANSHWQGRTLGAYRIEARIAAGGMGVVFSARRSDAQFERQVAIKLLNNPLASDDARRRFRVERQILADLNHPHIAQLLDGGTTEEGVPFLVMEYIEGLPIDRYCERNGLSTEDRLRLFVQVCAAVQFAHQHLIVHRDIKASNVMVTADGGPKLLDFGIAKLLDGAGGRSAVDLTVADARLLTPHNASPEQVRGSTITTASDIYSLGVLLYELLTGQPPFKFSNLTPAELERTICETEPDPPSRIRRQLAGDLDNIVMTAMRKEPARRYATATALADDIQRHLDDRPVLARPTAWRYRAGKFLRRNWLAASSALAVCLLIATLVGFYTLRLAAERDRAEIAAAKSRQVADFLTEVFRVPDPSASQGRETTAIELLDRGARDIDQRLADQPLVRADLLATIGLTYKNLSAYDLAGPMLERSLALKEAAGLRDTREYADTLYELANLRRWEGRFADSERHFKEALRIQLRIFAGPDQAIVATLSHLGTLYYEMGRSAESLEVQQRALAMTLAMFGEHDDASADRMNNLALVLQDVDRHAEAERYLRQALRIRSEILGTRHPDFLTTQYNLGLMLRASGRNSEAEQVQREVLAMRKAVMGADHPTVGFTQSALGGVLTALRKFDEAQSMLEGGQNNLVNKLGPDHWRVAIVLRRRGELSLARGDAVEAAVLMRRALDIEIRTYGDASIEARQTQAILASALMEQGQLAQAAQLLEASYEFLRQKSGLASSNITRTLQELGRLRVRQGRPAEAAPLLEQAISNYEHIGGPTNPDAEQARRALAKLAS